MLHFQGGMNMTRFEYNKSDYKKQIQTAAKRDYPDMVLKNATYLNVFTNEFLTGDIAITGDKIVGIGSYDGKTEIDCTNKTIVPGFIDGHIHLESTAVRPDVFAKAALLHGTTSVITDPHEISNVLGTNGLDYMMAATKGLPLDVFFMLPSCVPSCSFDESGAVIDSRQIKSYLKDPRVLGLAEMMNAPGVLSCDEETINKTFATLQAHKLIDGHAPSLTGSDLMAYVASGIYSDHECTTAQEGLEKLRAGQWIMIREGTASKNLKALLPLCKEPYASRCMFATDDRHINDILEEGYIDYIIRTAISNGVSPATAYKMASHCSATYFGLTNRGAIAPGYLADLILLSDIESVTIDSVYKNGRCMTKDVLDATCKQASLPYLDELVHDTIHIQPITESDLALKRIPEQIIGLVPEQLLTTDAGKASRIDVEQDILKVCVVERHKMTGHIGVCLIKGYGLKEGAIATSVAHDSHNIIAVGTNDYDLSIAIQALKKMRGGMVVVNHGRILSAFALPIAGLMSDFDAEEAKEGLEAIREAAYSLGVNHNIDPFMTLSFVSLPVIPKMKLTTLGIVNVDKFSLV